MVHGHPTSSVRGAALTLLGRRDYTALELRKRLIEKGHDAGEVDEQIESLTADGSLNDARVAASHIRVSSQVKGRGRIRIRHADVRPVDPRTRAKRPGQR